MGLRRSEPSGPTYKPYQSIGFGTIGVPQPCKIMGFGTIGVPPPSLLPGDTGSSKSIQHGLPRRLSPPYGRKTKAPDPGGVETDPKKIRQKNGGQSPLIVPLVFGEGRGRFDTKKRRCPAPDLKNKMQRTSGLSWLVLWGGWLARSPIPRTGRKRAKTIRTLFKS